jgi:hypothetical protein
MKFLHNTFKLVFTVGEGFMKLFTLSVTALFSCLALVTMHQNAEAQVKLDPILVQFHVERQTQILSNNLYMTWKLRGEDFDERAESKVECLILKAIIQERELPTNNNFIPEQTEAMKIVFRRYCVPFLQTGEFQDFSATTSDQ